MNRRGNRRVAAIGNIQFESVDSRQSGMPGMGHTRMIAVGGDRLYHQLRGAEQRTARLRGSVRESLQAICAALEVARHLF